MSNLNHLNSAPPERLASGAIKYASIQTWCEISGMSRSGTYIELGRRNLRAVKNGKRLLLDVEHGLAYMASLPSADIRAPKTTA